MVFNEIESRSSGNTRKEKKWNANYLTVTALNAFL